MPQDKPLPSQWPMDTPTIFCPNSLLNTLQTNFYHWWLKYYIKPFPSKASLNLFLPHLSIQQSMAASSPSLHLVLLPLTLLCLLRAASPDFASDQAECSDKLVGLLTCLQYVEGLAKAPTPDCCSGLKSVVAQSPKCLCVLIKDRNELSSSLHMTINVTLALSLPSVCSAPANISNCPKLLNLPPNSTDADIFKQFAQGNATSGTTGGKNGSTAVQASGGGTSDLLPAVTVTVVVGILLLLLLGLQLVVVNG